MSNYNLAFDGNYIFYRTLFVSKGYEKLSHTYLTKEKEQEEFARKFFQDFIHDVGLFPDYSNIIFCVDSSTWRKEYTANYKSNRGEKSSDVNWTNLYKIIDEILIILKKFGINVFKIDKFEGDDLLYYIKKHFLGIGENVIIFSNDKDISQLVDYNDKNFSLVYTNNSKSKKLLAKNGFKQKINTFELNTESDFDIFNMSDTFNNISDTFKKHDIQEIEPSEVVMNKIIQGDDGDNIKAIWTWKKGDRVYKTSQSYYDLIYKHLLDKLGEINPIELKNHKNIIDEIRLIVSKKSKQEINEEEFYERYCNNLLLICLDDNIIPTYLTESFDNIISNYEFKKTRMPKDVKTFAQDTRFYKEDIGQNIYSSLFS